MFYLELIRKKIKTPTCITKWKEIYPGFHNAHDELWSNIFYLAFSTTRDTNLQTFQYKIIHRLITCQKNLFEMKLVEKPSCTYCNDTDDISHFFLFCPKVNEFWNVFFNWWNTLGDIQIQYDCESLEESILFGFQAEGDILNVLNFCILLAKYYIYKQRIHNNNSIDFYQYLVQLKYKLKLEQTICTYNNNQNVFEKYIFIYEQL